jgi:hypothetical protein
VIDHIIEGSLVIAIERKQGIGDLADVGGGEPEVGDQ